MSKLNIPPDIRSKINQIDEIAGELIEYFSDSIRDSEEELPDEQNFEDYLNELQYAVTRYQESQGWLN